ncbi:MAG TPA: DNA cytosine methyltransferase [Candidatus Paceibacterota bacterium]|nr:DNA cytosine methyltransferase [Candidatus Paceibacterota bacterium]
MTKALNLDLKKLNVRAFDRVEWADGVLRRYFTVYEAKLIQTFPKDFTILGAWGEALRQIGNAVRVLLAEQVGRVLFNNISSETLSHHRMKISKVPVMASVQSGLVFSHKT